MPTEKEYDIQLFVKALLHKQSISNPSFSHQIMEELRSCIETSEMTDVQKIILTHRLGGYGLTGWTWNQLAEEFET